MKSLKYIKLWLGLGWLQTAFVIFLSIIPDPPVMEIYYGADKFMHILAYSILMYWFGMCYERGRSYGFVGAGLVIMGIVLELVQGGVGYRHFSYLDMMANCLGVFLGWLLSRTRLSLALVYLEKKVTVDSVK